MTIGNTKQTSAAAPKPTYFDHNFKLEATKVLPGEYVATNRDMLLVTVLGLVNKLPVIGAVNHWLGWGVGGIASLVDIYLVLCVVWALIVITGGNLTMLNDTVMSGSLYYKVFNVFNPFV